MLFTEKIFF
ncbi:hypothetical protein ECPA33_4890, partial [Escherichia coli PA33]